ncbi:Deoxynucleotidyltransferase terminal-interacting protein 2 [Tyrophagus putrescentiae]|nr:Deoxynucleotidyltransferase terminal-interacting protein 2 [Tyrophagus putrescentiae]
MFSFSDVESMHSNASSVSDASTAASSIIGGGHRAHRRRILGGTGTLGGGGLNSKSLLNDQFEAITNRVLGAHNYRSVASGLVMSELDRLKQKHNSSSNSKLTPSSADRGGQSSSRGGQDKARDKDHEEDEDPDNEFQQTTASVASDFDRYYGTSICADPPPPPPSSQKNHNKTPLHQPYIDFAQHTAETTAKLTRLLSTSTEKSLRGKTTLTEDIEQQFAIRPLRTSTRQKKKANSLAAKSRLPDWFDMPRVAEVTKDLEKDLAALQMRHVWNAKSFYKKSALEGVGGKDPTARYFQLGTVVEDKADFYADRLPKRARKQTIVDELLADQEVRATQKRRMAALMAKGGRARWLAQKAKARRGSAKLKARAALKTAKGQADLEGRPMNRVNAFRTYEI